MELPCNAMPLPPQLLAASQLQPSVVQDSEGRGGIQIASAARG